MEKCPVCGMPCVGKVGVSSHMFKTKDPEHGGFVERQNELIDNAFYMDISCEALAAQDDCLASTAYICGRWKKMPGYEERKSHSNAVSVTRQWREGKRQVPKNFTNAGQPYDLDKKTTISHEQHNLIVSLFASDSSIVAIAKKANCNPKTVHRTFVREFGEQATKERGRKSASRNCREVAAGKNRIGSDSYLGKAILEAFVGDEGIRTIGSRLDIGTCAIKRLWLEEFGEEAYEKRCDKMMSLQRDRAAATLDKAKFAGSQNERVCLAMLRKSFPDLEIKHHDYGIVPRLEIDISIPLLNVAITWDGPGHRRPVFGQSAFERTRANDIVRERILAEKGWRHISIVDEGRHDTDAVLSVVSGILALLESPWVGKRELFVCGKGSTADQSVFDTETEEKYARRLDRIAARKKQTDIIKQGFIDGLSAAETARRAGCCRDHVSKVWLREFGQDRIDSRAASLRNRTDEGIAKAIGLFDSDMSVADIGTQTGLSTRFVRKLWMDNFGAERFKERNRRLLRKGRPRRPPVSREAIDDTIRLIREGQTANAAMKLTGICFNELSAILESDKELRGIADENRRRKLSEGMSHTARQCVESKTWGAYVRWGDQE